MKLLKLNAFDDIKVMYEDFQKCRYLSSQKVVLAAWFTYLKAKENLVRIAKRKFDKNNFELLSIRKERKVLSFL